MHLEPNAESDSLAYMWYTIRGRVGARDKRSSNQLQELEAAYFLPRSYLLRSIEELLMQSGPNKQYAQSTAKAARQALNDRLELNLCQALTESFRRPSLRADHQHKRSSRAAEQCVIEQELLLSL